MLLAAGRGERLRPLTDDIPKALVQAGGKPSLQMSRLPWSEEWCLVKL